MLRRSFMMRNTHATITIMLLSLSPCMPTTTNTKFKNEAMNQLFEQYLYRKLSRPSSLIGCASYCSMERANCEFFIYSATIRECHLGFVGSTKSTTYQGTLQSDARFYAQQNSGMFSLALTC